MLGKFVRTKPVTGLALIALAAVIGCVGPGRDIVRRSARSEQELREAAGWYDPEAQAAVQNTIRTEDLLAFANQARAARKPEIPSPHKSILVLSGGGAYGAYPAGVLVGWSESGQRPQFDVVTGISTGSLLGCFAFLGQAYDKELRHFYTEVSNDDIFRKRHLPFSLLSSSLADSAPLARLIDEAITDERVAEMAAEHRKGRRLYIGTSDLDTRRAVVWDMGALAARDAPGDRQLFRNILLASAAIPGFFPPVRLGVTVDGVPHIERHVDGGTSSSMFFAPPWVPPEQRDKLPASWLYGSDLYVLVAGKVYPDPAPAGSRPLPIASRAVSTLMYDQTRSDLHKLFLLSILTGMNYNVSVIPRDLPAPTSATDFIPEQMCVMFEAGREWARTNRQWRQTPPGYEPGEGSKYRAGTTLTNLGPQPTIGRFGGE
jgi:predicted acylesterase/phospholipase RssA